MEIKLNKFQEQDFVGTRTLELINRQVDAENLAQADDLKVPTIEALKSIEVVDDPKIAINSKLGNDDGYGIMPSKRDQLILSEDNQ